MRSCAAATTSLLFLTFLVFANACTKPPAPLAGAYPEITVRDAQQGGHAGERVRWGGTIVSTTPGKDDTCVEVLARPLSGEARPRNTDDTEGRFIACTPGFFDPAVYAQGREVTIVGTLQEPEERNIGERPYRYPRVAAEKVYLWPKRERLPAYYYYPPWPDPFWYPAWGPWPYGPWYYSPLWGPWPYNPWYGRTWDASPAASGAAVTHGCEGAMLASPAASSLFRRSHYATRCPV